MSFEPIPGQFYRIVAQHSGKVAEIRHDQIHRGTGVQQGDSVGKPYQEFQFHREGPYFNIIARSSGRSFDVPSESQADDVQIVQWDRHDYSRNQQFSLLPAGGGAYYISARHSARFLCMKDGGKDYGVPLVQHVWNGGDHFRFAFVPVDPIVDPRATREIVLRGSDPIRDAVLGVAGLIPKVGGGSKFLLGLFWPDAGGSLLEQIRDYVRGVAKQLIEEAYLKDLALKMQGLKNVLKQYVLATPGADKGSELTSLITQLEVAQPYFFDQSAPEKTLPHLLTLGSLHLSTLRERYDHFEEFYGKKPANPAELLADLQSRVKLYVDGGQRARQKTMEWRLTHITLAREIVYVGGKPHHDAFIVNDTFDGWRFVADGDHLTYDQKQAIGQRAFDERKQVATDLFNAELDALFGPALAWKYVDPALTEKPKLVAARLASPLFGARRGTQFDGKVVRPEDDKPYSEVTIWTNAAGDRVNGLWLERRDGPRFTVGKVVGTKHYHRLREGEVVVGAYGNHGGPGDALYSLYLVTSTGHIVGGGHRANGTPWDSEPPIGTDPQLDSVFGWADADHIDGLGFRWRYSRKE